MPLSKKIASYPPNMRELARKMQGLLEPFTISFPTTREAVQKRQLIYGFAGALEASGEQNLADAMRACKIQLAADPPGLIFTSRINSSDWDFVEQVIAQASPQAERIDLQHTETKETSVAPSHMDQVLVDLGYSPLQSPQPSQPPQPLGKKKPESTVDDAYEAFLNRKTNDDESGGK